MNTETRAHLIANQIKSMSGKEILQVMIDGLKSPAFEIDMGTYGDVDDGICYGCAATNFIAQLEGWDRVSEEQMYKLIQLRHFSFDDESNRFIANFEDAIDELRQGDIHSYNMYAEIYGFATIDSEGAFLPYLTSEYTKYDLMHYQQLADSLPE